MLNENIRKFRKSKGLSQEELAIKLHVVRQTVSKWEKGYSVPDSELLQKTAAELGVTVSDLLSDDNGKDVEKSYDISDELEKINGILAKEVKKRKIIFRVFAVIILLAASVFAFLKLTYFSPHVAYVIAKPYDKATDRYCEFISLCYQSKMNMPLNRETKKILSEFTEKNQAIVKDIQNNCDAPMNITVSVVTDRDYTVVRYSGTATKNGHQVEYMNYFFVMKKLKPAS